MTALKTFFTKKIPHFQQSGELLFEKSIDILHKAQLASGAIAASLPGTRYAKYMYPRDHAYGIRALVALSDKTSAHKAIRCILTCQIDENDIMYQRYTQDGHNASYKPPQIDGNAQTILSLTAYLHIVRSEQLKSYFPMIKRLVRGIHKQTKTFAHGKLVYTHNGIIEFSPFEAGYDLYSNAVCFKALLEIARFPEIIGKELALKAHENAQEIKKGIVHYLYYQKEKTFLTCLREEPDSSYVMLPNLKNYLALSDFDVLEPGDSLLDEGLLYHLNGTFNKELQAYNRYHELLGRHNFGNGPWPMVMLRLAQYYAKTNQLAKAEQCFTWVINVALKNLDRPYCLPEHIATREAFLSEYELFKTSNEVSPRPAKEKEYALIAESKTMQKWGLVYAVNPLMWSHAQFILAWLSVYPDTLSHNSQSSSLY